MLNLLKADFKRMVKDKLFLVICIVAFALAVFSSLLYFGLDALLTNFGEEGATSMFDARSLALTGFPPLGDFGLILGILMAILINKDYSYGTIRNKLITGKTRFEVYTSTFISGVILIISLMTVYSLLSFGLSALFLDYSIVGIKFVKDLPYMLLSYLFAIMIAFVFSSMLILLCNIKSAGLGIVLYYVLGFIGTIIASVISVCIPMINPEFEFIKNILEFLNYCNPYYLLSGVIGYGTEYEIKEIVAIFLNAFIYGFGFYGLGFLLFRKKDIK